MSIETKLSIQQDTQVDDYLNALAQTIHAMPLEEIWTVIQVLFNAWRAGRHVFLFGNGGSSATAAHMANDLNKLTIAPGKPRMKAICLSDNVPLLTAWANDQDYADVFAEQLANFVQPGDVVIAISSSGNSPNVLRGLEAAHRFQAITIGFTGDQGGKLKDLVDICIRIPDAHMGRQEDGHMILDHVISNTLRDIIAKAD